MKTNMGTADRVIRLSIVALVTILYFIDNIAETAAIILGILAVIFMFTSFSGFCPLYYPFKITSIRKKK